MSINFFDFFKQVSATKYEHRTDDVLLEFITNGEEASLRLIADDKIIKEQDFDCFDRAYSYVLPLLSKYRRGVLSILHDLDRS